MWIKANRRPLAIIGDPGEVEGVHGHQFGDQGTKFSVLGMGDVGWTNLKRNILL